MAKAEDSRINDPDGFLTGRIVDPATLADARTDTGNTAGTRADNGDDIARDESGNPKRNKDGSPQRKRGRKPGSGNSTASSSRKNSSGVEGIEKILFSAHMMLAGMTKAPELMLDQQESKMLAGAIQSVQDFYNFETSAEIVLWTNVIGICGAVYGPRIFAIAARRKKDKKVKPAQDKQSDPVSVLVTEGFTAPHHAPAE